MGGRGEEADQQAAKLIELVHICPTRVQPNAYPNFDTQEVTGSSALRVVFTILPSWFLPSLLPLSV